MPDQALEYMSERGGLPIAARYLARAVALPPSNTSWYMGLSNGAAGLCAHPARLAWPPCPLHSLDACMPGGCNLLVRMLECQGSAEGVLLAS